MSRIDAGKWTYACIKPEIGVEKQRDHLHIFIQVKSEMTNKLQMIDFFNQFDTGIDVKPVNYGNTDNVKNYTEKDHTQDGDIWEYGTYTFRSKGQGSRSDVNAFKEAIENDMPKVDLYRNFFHEMSVYRNSYLGYKQALQKEKMYNMVKESIQNGKHLGIKTKVCYGRGNVGKTFESLKELIADKFYFINFNNEKTIYFHDFENEKYILFDDFHANIPYSLLLDITDITRKTYKVERALWIYISMLGIYNNYK